MLLQWKRDTYAACKADVKDIKCSGADKIRAKEEEKRNTDKYYEKSSSDREADDKLIAEETKKYSASLVAAALEAAKPKAGESGFSCKKDADGKRPSCSDANCCGQAKEKGKTDVYEMCHDKASTSYTKGKDDKKIEMEFACIAGAKHLATSGAALLAAAYLMA